MPRPKVHDAALRMRLLELAGQTLSAHGLGALSLRKLAADAGTSTTAVYSLFGGKPALLKALFDEAFQRFRSHLAVVGTTENPVEDLRRLSLAYRASALADPHFYDVMFGSARAEFTPDAESAALAASTFQPLLDAVRRAITAGVLPDAEPGEVALALWAVAHGLVSLELRGYLPLPAGDSERLFSRVLRAQLAGWRPPAGP